MKRHRAGRSGDERRRTGQGGIVLKRCPGCHQEVLSAFRGDVTRIGQGEIEEVKSNGDIVGKCGGCGGQVLWKREIGRPEAMIRSG